MFGHVRGEPGNGKDEHSGFGLCKLTRTSPSRDDSPRKGISRRGPGANSGREVRGVTPLRKPQAGQRPQSAPGPSPELFLPPEGERTRPAHARPRSGRWGPAETLEDGGGPPQQRGPSRPAGSNAVRWRERAASPHPHAGRAGQALHGASAPTPNEAGPSHPARGAGPEEVGPARGRRLHPPPPPARPSAASGGGGNAAPGPAAARGGEEPDSGAQPPPPRSPARQPGPPRSGARAGPEREEAARGAEKAGAAPRPSPPTRSLTTHPSPLQPVPGLGLRTDLTGRDMFAVETGPSRGAKDQDPPHPARSAPHPPQLRPRRPLPPSPELLASQTPPLPGSGPLNQTSPPLPSLFKMDESNQPKMRQSRRTTEPTRAGGLRPSTTGHWQLLPDARSSLVRLNHHVPQAPPRPRRGPTSSVRSCLSRFSESARPQNKNGRCSSRPLVATPELQIRLGSRLRTTEKKDL